MTVIGMLHYRKDPSKVFKSYAYAAVAKAEGVDFFYFTPGSVNFENRVIAAKYYENGSWIDKNSPFPDIIYNAGGALSSKQQTIIHRLSDEIPFTSYSIGDKVSVYNRIKKANEFAQYLIPTITVTSVSDILKQLNLHKKVVIKPVSGRQGIGVASIEDQATHYTFIENALSTDYTKEELINVLLKITNDNQYLVQPYIASRTKNDLVFDFRLHVQKNGSNHWVVTAIYPRIGVKGGIAANISGGGYTNLFESFLKQEFSEDYYNMKRYLERFALMFSAHFDSLYEEPLDELGIDVGLDKNRKIWMYEVNWRPGPPPIYYLELDVVKNTILYAKHLVEQKTIQ